MKRKTKAILMNILILPGLGQIYLGRRVIGLALIMVVNLLLLLALFMLLKGASPLIAAKVTSGGISTTEIVTALDSVAGFGKGLLASLVAVWVFALADLVRNSDEA